MQFLELKTIFGLSPDAQIAIICALFVWTVYFYYREFKKTGKIRGRYPTHMSVVMGKYPLHLEVLFAPIYEEVLFRGFMLAGLLTLYPVITATVISSFLFGLWHLKNIFWEGKRGVFIQMLYTGLFFGPIAAAATLWTGTIWLAVMLHFIGNTITFPLFEKLLKRL